MGQETPRFSCKEGQVLRMKPAARYPVRALLSWCNLSLPALDDFTFPSAPVLACTPLVWPSTLGFISDSSTVPGILGHAVTPSYKLPFQSQLLVLFSW